MRDRPPPTSGSHLHDGSKVGALCEGEQQFPLGSSIDLEQYRPLKVVDVANSLIAGLGVPIY